jgi:hypothetical protein
MMNLSFKSKELKYAAGISLVNKNRLAAILIGVILFCFVAGTAIVLASGSTKAIENIKVGDYVKSYNESTGKVENKRVLQTFENTVTELTKITTSDGQEIVATPGHKFFANNKWVSAEDLRAGDILVNVNGQKVIVEAIQHEILEKPVKVYNFEVEGNHNYFVGDNDGVLVHNAGCNNILNEVKGGVGKYKNVRVDVELGGSGLVNKHVHVDGAKFMYKGTTFAGAPNVINKSKDVAKALAKGLKEALKRGWSL